MNVDTSSKSEQRKFGIVMAVAISVLGLIRYALHGFEHFPVYFFVVAAVFLVLGLAVPKVLQPVLVVWMKFALALNWVVMHLLLSITFYLMITPVRVLVSIFGDDPLKRDWQRDTDSFWEEPEEQPKEFERYRQMF